MAELLSYTGYLLINFVHQNEDYLKLQNVIVTSFVFVYNSSL